jgi:cyclomaltodextrinase / maltogenic alpha-amylase / neopullulanase
MPPQWIYDAVFYHIYPLGLCDAPKRNDFTAAPAPRLERMYRWIDHIVSLNLNAVYLGPLFESTAHGYDTANYYEVDRRLGTNETLRNLVHTMKSRGLRVILDGVFNHVGRDFWAFRDLREKGSGSAYVDWFYQLDFDRTSTYGDPFAYEGWAGHYSLVKLNLHHPEVRRHLFDAVTMWVREFDIDGLRLDAADCLDHDFLRALADHCRNLKSDFWLMGEVVHGDYRQWANPGMLDATTNYECYKGLYSSHVGRNYFEIAHSLNRQFGSSGIYRDLMLYSFADNHDVNRVASNLENPAHLYPLHILLSTMPGVPSIYYGSEWGILGQRTPQSDTILRPAIDLDNAPRIFPNPDLVASIQRLMSLRRDLPALRYGDYEQLHVAHEQLAFARHTADQTVIVAVNGADKRTTIPLKDLPAEHALRDRLNGNVVAITPSGKAEITVYPNWGCVFVVE